MYSIWFFAKGWLPVVHGPNWFPSFEVCFEPCFGEGLIIPTGFGAGDVGFSVWLGWYLGWWGPLVSLELALADPTEILGGPCSHLLDSSALVALKGVGGVCAIGSTAGIDP